MRKRGVALLLAMAATVSVSMVTAADEPICQSQLMAVPLETLPLPEDLRLTVVTLTPAGSWSATAQPGDAEYPAIYIQLDCTADPALYLERTLALRVGLDGWDPVEPIEVGDDAFGLELYDSGGRSISVYWRHGPVVGAIHSYGASSVADVVERALAVDALLP